MVQLHPRASFRLTTAVALMFITAIVGVGIVMRSLAAVPAVITVDPGAGATVASGASRGGDATTSYVQFGSVAVAYCGGRVPDANCIGLSAMAAHQCGSNAACQAAGFLCWASNTNAFVYDVSNFGGSHSGGRDQILNPAVCGYDIHNILARTAADGVYGVIPNNSKHNAASANTQATLLSFRKINYEYDPTKP